MCVTREFPGSAPAAKIDDCEPLTRIFPNRSSPGGTSGRATSAAKRLVRQPRHHLSPTGTSCSVPANEVSENWEPRANGECLGRNPRMRGTSARPTCQPFLGTWILLANWQHISCFSSGENRPSCRGRVWQAVIYFLGQNKSLIETHPALVPGDKLHARRGAGKATSFFPLVLPQGNREWHGDGCSRNSRVVKDFS